MPRDIPAFHRDVADRNHRAIVDAATALFLDAGYDHTSLARVAERAGVSRATLFKQFATKAALFEAAVLAAAGNGEGTTAVPPVGDLRSGLLTLGQAYADLLRRPETAGLMRMLVAASPRFPDLRERTFDFGAVPTLTALRAYLRAEQEAGAVVGGDVEIAATQLLGMIASAVFWPSLVHGTWSITAAETRIAVEEAVTTTVARWGADGPSR